MIEKITANPYFPQLNKLGIEWVVPEISFQINPPENATQIEIYPFNSKNKLIFARDKSSLFAETDYVGYYLIIN